MAITPRDIQFAKEVIDHAVEFGRGAEYIHPTDDPTPQYAVNGLTVEENTALVAAASNDGKITPDEIRSFEKFPHAAKMQEIGRLIGDRPSALYENAQRLSEGNDAAAWYGAKHGWVHPVWTPEYERASRTGFDNLQEMARNGENIGPAVRMILQKLVPSPIETAALAQLDFGSLSVADAKSLSKLLQSSVVKAEQTYGADSQQVRNLKTALRNLTVTEK